MPSDAVNAAIYGLCPRCGAARVARAGKIEPIEVPGTFGETMQGGSWLLVCPNCDQEAPDDAA